MPKPMIRIHNTATGEILDREMNDAEFAQYEADLKTRSDEVAKVNAETTAKNALLTKLGINADEARLLLS